MPEYWNTLNKRCFLGILAKHLSKNVNWKGSNLELHP